MSTNIVSVADIVGYFAGMPTRGNINSATLSVLDKMSNDVDAVKLRTSCLLRSSIYRNWSDVNLSLKCGECWRDIKFVGEIYSMLYGSEISDNEVIYSSAEELCDQLNTQIEYLYPKLSEYVPYWVNLEAVRTLFLTDKSDTDKYLYEDTLRKYRVNIKNYPFQCWVNLKSYSYSGLIFQNDYNFIKYVYKQYNIEVPDNISFNSDEESKVEYLKSALSKNNITLVVDCENFDPYKLTSFLGWVEQQGCKGIQRIILVDDINTNKMWKTLYNYTSIPITYIKAERVIPTKSNLDIYLTSTISKDYYLFGITDYILASSDSDYVPFMTSLNGANFIVLYENAKWSSITSSKLDTALIPHVSVDSLGITTDDVEDDIVSEEIENFFKTHVLLDIDEFLTKIYLKCHITGSKSRKEFMSKYLSNLTVKIVDNKIMFDTNGGKKNV